MDLPSDILRLIILICKINDIKNICFVTVNFYSLCSEKNLWLEKFKEKDLMIINDKINNISQYINEYKKISYATYTANCLYNMVGANFKNYFSVPYYRCWFSPYFSINDLTNILSKDHPIFRKISIYNSIEKYIAITIQIVSEKGLIDYHYHRTTDENDIGIILSSDYNNKNDIMSLIAKILYHYQSIIIYDIDYYPMIITKNTVLNIVPFQVQNRIDRRKKYWDECYSKYEELYF
jgi:hypothetical protein